MFDRLLFGPEFGENRPEIVVNRGVRGSGLKRLRVLLDRSFPVAGLG